MKAFTIPRFYIYLLKGLRERKDEIPKKLFGEEDELFLNEAQ
jgi:hypothetical protein